MWYAEPSSSVAGRVEGCERGNRWHISQVRGMLDHSKQKVS